MTTTVNTSTIIDDLNTKGYAIVENVLSEEECNAMVSGAWDFVENATKVTTIPVDRSDPNSWKGVYALSPLHSMLIQHYGIGHSQFCWDVRGNANVKDSFSKVWGTEDLIVSFDGASIGMPHEVTKRGWYRGNDWFHVDQSPTATGSGRVCVQGWVTGIDVRAGDATLALLEGSHNHFDDLNKVFGVKDKSNWYKLLPAELAHFKERCPVKHIECKAGSLVLWDSRMVHAGREALLKRERPNMRVVSYVCMTPRTWANPAAIKKIKANFEAKRTTTHTPHKQKVFPKQPRFPSAESKKIISPDFEELVLSEGAKALLC